MIATDPAAASIIVASIAAIASVVTTGLAVMNRRSLSTNNGHTAGQGIARIEDQMRDHEGRLDRIEVKLAEDMGDIKQRLTSAVFDQERHMATYRHDRRLVDE